MKGAGYEINNRGKLVLDQLKFEPHDEDEEEADDDDSDRVTWLCKNDVCPAEIVLEKESFSVKHCLKSLPHKCPPCLKMKLENYIRIGKYYFELESDEKHIKTWKCRGCDLTLQTDKNHSLMNNYDKAYHSCLLDQ